MKQLALNISKEFVKWDVIPESDIDIYRYGLEILISSTLTSLSVLALACLLDSFAYGLLYLLITIPLRITAGGYHADTYRKCFTISNLLYIVLSFTLRLLQNHDLSPIFWLVLLYMSALYIFVKAPISNIHQPLSYTATKRNKRQGTIYLLLDCTILTFMTIMLPTSSFVHLAILSVALVALLIIPTQKGETPK